jgi:selenocysteine lyase/cysteine desulfurase
VPAMDPAALRAEFPVLDSTAYLNTGTDGPIPRAAARAAAAEIERQAAGGRSGAHFGRVFALRAELRAAYAARLGAAEDDVALTTSTSEGLATAVLGLGLRPGDEIVTSAVEHPGLVGALQAARDLDGAEIRVVPFDRVADAVTPRTRLVACSHVCWIDGRLAPDLRGLDVPVILDGAQGAGAVPTDVAALGCDAYAGSGQKWLCGPDGLGMLWVSPALRERLAATRRAYLNFAEPGAGLDAPLHAGARRFDAPALSAEALAFAVAAHGVLEAAGWPAVHDRAAALAAALAARLEAAGRTVAPRGATTLVAFHSDDPPAEKERLAAQGIVVRDLPGRPLLRASVGAWSDEGDIARLVTAL